jgi:peptidoglycan hydrolase-like protein with peptidoglycan-binding domain
MKKAFAIYIIVGIGIISLIFVSCAKKKSEVPLDEMQTQLNAESLSSQAVTKVEPVAPSLETQTTTAVETATSATSVSSKPTTIEIQTALKNAGYYTGAIDGKLGPKSQKAIESFQKDNGLVADGKVGAKTWAKLQAHLNAAPEQKTGD